MKLLCLFGLIAAIAQAGVVSRDWSDGRLSLTLDDGSAEIEWISSITFRVSRSWRVIARDLAIAHDPVGVTFEESGERMTMRSKYLTVELDRTDLRMRVRSGQTPVTEFVAARAGEAAEIRFEMTLDEKVFGLGGGGDKLDRRGQTRDERNGLFWTSRGYGVFVRSPARSIFDMASGIVTAPGARSIEFLLYYGPTPKEIFEQHLKVAGARVLRESVLEPLTADRLPQEATPLSKAAIDSWDGLRGLVRTLNQWSLSAVLYPALDLASFDRAPREIKQRAVDLSALLPVVYRSSGEGAVDAGIREAWNPYLITYLREAYERGIPVIRPLPLQFSRDETSDRQADVFMLGDEVLLAPMLGPGTRRKLDLPRGIWTDLRTNSEYRGGQSIEVDAPMGRVPMFVRNGWIVPLSTPRSLELHYFPSLAAEFFLWESESRDNSQFHAAPAGDFVRLEIESKVGRTYEWVLHHMKAAREVAEERAYTRVAQRGLLRPGTWWHDAANNNLHVMLRAAVGSDRIVNISF